MRMSSETMKLNTPASMSITDNMSFDPVKAYYALIWDHFGLEHLEQTPEHGETSHTYI